MNKNTLWADTINHCSPIYPLKMIQGAGILFSHENFVQIHSNAIGLGTWKSWNSLSSKECGFSWIKGHEYKCHLSMYLLNMVERALPCCTLRVFSPCWSLQKPCPMRYLRQQCSFSETLYQASFSRSPWGFLTQHIVSTPTV